MKKIIFFCLATIFLTINTQTIFAGKNWLNIALGTSWGREALERHGEEAVKILNTHSDILPGLIELGPGNLFDHLEDSDTEGQEKDYPEDSSSDSETETSHSRW
jgi:hypothetical protein